MYLKADCPHCGRTIRKIGPLVFKPGIVTCPGCGRLSFPLSPLLFDFGVDAISGTRVVDPETAMRCIGQGANYRQIKGVQRLTMLK